MQLKLDLENANKVVDVKAKLIDTVVIELNKVQKAKDNLEVDRTALKLETQFANEFFKNMSDREDWWERYGK